MNARGRSFLLALAALNVVAVFLVQLIILARLGPGGQTDAFMAATTLPQMLAGMASVALSSVLIPMFAGEKMQEQNMDAWFLLAVIGAVVFALALLLNLTAERWVNGLFPGLTKSDSQLCISLARIQIFSMVFSAMNSVVVAVCYARGRFLRVEMAAFGVAVASVACLYVTLPIYGIMAAAWTFTLTTLVQLLLLLPNLAWPRSGVGSTHKLVEAWKRIRPLLAGNLYYKSDILVDRYLLSMAGAGDLTMFSLAQQIYGAAVGILGKVWGSTAIPDLAVYVKARDRQGFIALYRRRLTVLLLASGGAYLILMIAGKPILALLLGYGKVSADDIATLWVLLMCLGGVLVLGSLGVLLSGAFYALGDTKTPTYLSVASFTLFIGLKYFAFTFFGMIGVALAASSYFAVNALFLAAMLPAALRRRVEACHYAKRP